MEPVTCFRRIIFIIMFLPVSASSSSVVVVNGSARLTCNKPCSGEIKCVYAKWSQILVTKCKEGSCLEGDAFKNRTELTISEDGVFLQLNKVEYSDNGMYIFSCDNSELCHKTLVVFAPVPVSATAGENLTIPFHAHTNKLIADHDILYRCEKDGELVVELQHMKLLYGPGFKGHVSMSLDKYRTGDLSLTIFNIQQSDGGTYHCIHRHMEAVQPEAVTLNVTVPTSTAMPAKDSKGREHKTWLWLGILFGLNGLLLVG